MQAVEMSDGNQLNMFVDCPVTAYTRGVGKDILLNVKLSQRTPKADLEIALPNGLVFDPGLVSVNVIGRGFAALEQLELQSSGRCALGNEVTVGRGRSESRWDGSHYLFLRELDLRADNGIDVQVLIPNARFTRTGRFPITILADTLINGAYKVCQHTVEVESVCAVTDLCRSMPKQRVFDGSLDLQAAELSWTAPNGAESVKLMHSADHGANWRCLQTLTGEESWARINGLTPDQEHWFRLNVTGGEQEGVSNAVKVFSGMYNVRTAGGAATDGMNAAPQINRAIEYMDSLGGGIILFEGGCFRTTTIRLKSNVWLYVDGTAEICALPGCDDEEQVWFSDEEFRADQSHMSLAPYLSPKNWMTKQDTGHSYFRNALFFGERLDNVKIIGNGVISGEGNLFKSSTVLDQLSGLRADKLASFKLCTNIELGGVSIGRDLWYEETDSPNTDEPFYIGECGERLGTENMLHIRNAGHFVVLATGCDGVTLHDVFAEKGEQVRDIFDCMGCNDMAVFNVYAEGAPDDIVKLGSDCSLSFTRPSRNGIVRNIIGDTACNLFQIGSETADDIQDICIDNIYVLASNKAGFSISVNDGGHIRNIHLNCGGSAGQCRCGIDHGNLTIGYNAPAEVSYPSVMRRIRTPFFISLSNRGRTLGARVVPESFVDDTGVCRDELMVTNVNIGRIENVFLSNLRIWDVYGASQAKSPTRSRWPLFDCQPRTTPLIVGYKIPDNAAARMPDGDKVRHIENVVLENMDLTVRGGNPATDACNKPRELGVGQFNLRNLAEDDRASKIPAFGLYVRHVSGLTIRNCTIGVEEYDGRYGIVLDDVNNIKTENLTVQQPDQNRQTVKII